MATSNRNAASLLCKLLAVLMAGCILFLGIFYGIVSGKPAFDDTYQSVIQRKYEKLINTQGPKIVIVGGSNAGFGIDSLLMEELTGYPVVNMGLHAGFGCVFPTELMKRHIGEGDIVILAYEYGLVSSILSKLGDANLIMSGIDTKVEMYRDIPLKNIPELFGNLFQYATYKASRTKLETGVYSSSSFDAQGNMTLVRSSCLIPDYAEKIDIYGRVSGASLMPQHDNFAYLNELREYIYGKGASVYFTSAVLMKEAYEGTAENLLDYAAEMERRTGIPYISDPNRYLFPTEYMFDTIYHCNDAGEDKRTELLVEDLRSYGILD